MKAYTPVSRKNVGEDRVAICPNFGCEYLTRVKPFKLRFFGFEKHPKCKKHHIPLVYVDERIGDFMDAALACLFDKAGLPPSELLNSVKSKFPDEFNSFVEGWVYCITAGRGEPIVSRYMDTISNAYLKQLTKKQIKSLNKGKDFKPNLVNKAINDGMDEIAIQYTRIIKHLRVHSEILVDHQELKSLSKSLRNFLKDWQKYILKHNEIINSPETEREMTLKEIKSNYDQILNIGICRCLLGLNPESKEIKRAKLTAFDRFSAYHNFFCEGLSVKFTKSDKLILLNNNYQKQLVSRSMDLKNLKLKLDIKEDQTTMAHSQVFNINMLNFQNEVMIQIKNVVNLIECTKDQKEMILLKSDKILDELIARVENNELYIRKDSNPKKIATTVIYTAIISEDKTPNLSMTSLSKIARISTPEISKLYKRYFSNLYPNKDFSFSTFRDFKKIRDKISLYFFEIYKDSQIEKEYLLDHLKDTIQYKKNYITSLTKEEIKRLNELLTQYQNTFNRYFSDLAEVIKSILIMGVLNKQVGAPLMLSSLVDSLRKDDITLLQTSLTFYNTVRDIFKSLKKKYPIFLPRTVTILKGISKEDTIKFVRENIKIVGSRIKIYIIKNIYSGKYYENGLGKCPECEKEGMVLNTDISRLVALDFHHNSKEKEKKYTVSNLYHLFSNNRNNPEFLNELIKSLESEKVILLCANHHRLLHSKIYNNFSFLINFKNIFSFSSELIHMIIMTSLNNYQKTKELSKLKKKKKRDRIKAFLKKRYIIDHFYGESCHICKEFNIGEYLPVFHFHHEDDQIKTINASELFHLPCSEIVKILEKEKGGYICANCHMTLQYISINSLDKIYDDSSIIKKIYKDYNEINRSFLKIKSNTSILDPLDKSIKIFDSFERYLTAIYKISESGQKVHSTLLKKYMNLDLSTIHKFFRRNEAIIKNFVDVSNDTSSNSNSYKLTEEGKKAIHLIFQFKKYYASI